MTIKNTLARLLAISLVLLIALPLPVLAQEIDAQPVLRQEEFDPIVGYRIYRLFRPSQEMRCEPRARDSFSSSRTTAPRAS